MDVNKLPPSLLVALGLVGCGPSVEVPPAGTDTGTGESLEGPMTTACLECPIDTCDDVTTGPCLAEAEVSGCLSPPQSTSDTTTGPCLEPDVTFINPDTETVTGSGTDTDTDTDTDGTGSSSTTGATADARSQRDDLLRKLVEGGVLPPDLATRLRGRA
jgi:hypothetical protein